MTLNFSQFTSSPLLSLAPELQYHILSFLKEDVKNLIHLSSVCRAFYAVVINYEQCAFPIPSWPGDSKKWNVITCQKEEKVSLDFTRIQNAQESDYFTSSLLYCDEDGTEYRKQLDSHGTMIFISKFSEALGKKLWKIIVTQFVNIHPFKEGFILVCTQGYIVYRWDEHGELIEDRRGNTQEVHSSAYLNETLFLSMSNYPDCLFNYSINPHDPTSQLKWLDRKNLKSSEEVDERKRQFLIKLGNDLYCHSIESEQAIFTPVQSHINRTNAKDSVELSDIRLDVSHFKTYFGEIETPSIIANENWTIYYSLTKCYILRKNQIWMEYQNGLMSGDLFIISDFLFICDQDQFQVFCLPAKKEVTDLFSPISQFLTNNKNNRPRLHSCSIQYSKGRTVVSAFMQKYQNYNWSQRPEMVLFKFSISLCKQFVAEDNSDKSDNDSEEETEAYVIPDTNPTTQNGIEEEMLNSNIGEDDTEEVEIGMMHPHTADLNHLTESDNEGSEREEKIDTNVNLAVLNNPQEERSDSDDKISNTRKTIVYEEKTDEEEGTDEILNTHIPDNLRYHSLDQSLVISSSSKITPMTPKNMQRLSCSLDKVIFVVSFIFAFGGICGTLVLIASHPGPLLFKVSIVHITLPTAITLGFTGLSTINAVSAAIVCLVRKNKKNSL